MSIGGLNNETTIYQFQRMDFSNFNEETIIPEGDKQEVTKDQDQAFKGAAEPRAPLLPIVQEEPNLNEMTNMSNMMIHDLSLNYSEDIHKTLLSKKLEQTMVDNNPE